MKNLIAFILLLFILSPFRSQAQCGESSRELLGSISAITMYNTYVAIGSFADMHTNQVITSEQLVSYTDEQVAMLAVLVDSYNKALKEDAKSYSDDDKQFMRNCVNILGLLRSEALALKKYAAAATDNNADEYQLYRNKAWVQISDLLGLEDE